MWLRCAQIDKTIISETPHDTYIERVELWYMPSDSKSPPLKMTSIYALDGSYVGTADDFKHLKSKGIVPERSKKDHQVASIGYSDKKKKFFGWSHRAINGFAIGDDFFDEGSMFDDKRKKSKPKKIETFEEAKQSAINFAEAVASSNGMWIKTASADVAAQIAKVASQCTTIDAGGVWWNSKTRTVWWSVGDSHNAYENGCTPPELVKKAYLAIPGIKEVCIEWEYTPHTDKEYEEVEIPGYLRLSQLGSEDERYKLLQHGRENLEFTKYGDKDQDRLTDKINSWRYLYGLIQETYPRLNALDTVIKNLKKDPAHYDKVFLEKCKS